MAWAVLTSKGPGQTGEGYLPCELQRLTSGLGTGRSCTLQQVSLCVHAWTASQRGGSLCAVTVDGMDGSALLTGCSE